MIRSPLSRRDVLFGAAGMGLTLATGAHAATDGFLTAADVHVNGYPTVEAVRWIGKQLEERTGGRLRIRVYFAGQLGREGDTVDLTRFGALDITRVNFAALNNPFPLTQLFALPYVFDSVDHMRRVVDGEGGRLVLEGFEQRNLIGLAIYDAGSRSFYNVRRAIHEPQDLQGLKFRVPPSDIFLEMAAALGAEPTPLPFGEVYSALQTHLIDGAENNWRSFQSSRHFEVARYLSRTEHSYSPEALLMSRRTFDALSSDDRELVAATARESVPYMRSLWDRMEEEARQIVLASGVHFNEVDRDAFHKAAAPVLEQYVARTDLRQIYELVRAAA
ncbi:TRAP transporter substrate-binding protein [Povalibacter sp.]|uniref:TRAP transporter substrate-binding protein n=1 Tax=Povalibacter sp. TaxID=1962978 RepID=UPI002F428E35